MPLDGKARQLTIIVDEDDTWHGTPLYTELVHRAQAAGLAGASVFRGIEGFGASHHIHTSRILSLSNDLPVAVIIVDVAEKIDAFVSDVRPLVTEGVVTVADVDVVHDVERSSGQETGGQSAGDGQ